MSRKYKVGNYKEASFKLPPFQKFLIFHRQALNICFLSVKIYRVLRPGFGKNLPEKSLRPFFLVEKKSSPTYFFLKKKSLRPFFLVEKKVLPPPLIFFRKKVSAP